MNLVESSQVFVSRRDVIACELPDGLALLDPRAGKYFALNTVGAHIWNIMQSRIATDDIVASVRDNFDVAEDDCEADVGALLKSLIDADLAETSGITESE